MTAAPEALAELVRKEWGRLLAASVRAIGSMELAEESLSEAIESAMVHWQRNGMPASPKGWLLKVARRKAIDRIRRQKTHDRNADALAHLMDLDQTAHDGLPAGTDEIPDERLRLIFTCCHPALDRKSSVALTLRMLCGLTTAEIAHAFLDAPETMAQRLVRAKRKISAAGIPYEVPGPDLWAERLDSVLHVVYLVFNEGYAASGGPDYMRPQLVAEAIHLGRMLLQLLPGEAEAEGLLALMLLHDSRRFARLDRDGVMIALDSQDRRLWDRQMAGEGEALITRALGRGRPGPFQMQAAISAVHSAALSAESTDWPQILLLYGELHRMTGSTVVRLNQIVALARVEGPYKALELCEGLASELAAYQPFHAALADLRAQTGDVTGSVFAYREAVALSASASERLFLEQRLKAVQSRQ